VQAYDSAKATDTLLSSGLRLTTQNVELLSVKRHKKDIDNIIIKDNAFLRRGVHCIFQGVGLMAINHLPWSAH
jgi:hypothetical protein